jgi:hypothetical protein
MKKAFLMLITFFAVTACYAQNGDKAAKKTEKKLYKQERMHNAKNGNQMMRNLNKAAKKQDKFAKKASKSK